MERWGAERDRHWLALALLCVAHLLVVDDVSIVNVALPTIVEELSFSQGNLSWVINAYTFVFGGFLLLGGRLADLLGRRAVFVAGLVTFVVASLACGLAPSAALLVVARITQGLGGAILVPSALSIVATTFNGAERNRALGVFGAVGGLGFVVGVLLGGLLTASMGWRWVFFVNVPVGVAVALLSPLLITRGSGERGPRSFDLLGALTATAGLGALVYSVADAGSAGPSIRTAAALALAVCLLIAFAVVEVRTPSPLVPFAVFRVRAFTGSVLVMLLVGAGVFSTFYFLSLYLQQVMGYGPLRTGVAFVPLAVAIVIGANAASVLATRFGAGTALAIGLLGLASSLLWLSQVEARGTYLGEVLLPSVLAGIGVGSSVVPATIAAVGALAEKRAGLASGLITTAQQAGGAVGLAVLAAVSTLRADVTPGVPGAQESLAAGFRAAMVLASGLVLVGFVLALVFVRGFATGGEGVR